MANSNDFAQDENKDLDLLNGCSILRVSKHPEKVVKFKIKKHELYRKFTEVNEHYFSRLETEVCDQDEIIDSLKSTIDRLTYDLSREMALSSLLNSEAVKNARLAISMVPKPPDMGAKRQHLTLVKR